jgi:hypothetical protein
MSKLTSLTDMFCLYVLRRFRSSKTLSLMCCVRIGQRGSHSGEYEDSGPPGRDAVHLGGSVPTLRNETYLVYPEDGACKLPRDVGTHLPRCRTSQMQKIFIISLPV